MGKYAYVKLIIILYHKSANLSIGFAKIFLKRCKKPSLYFGTRAIFYCFFNTVFIIVENFGGIP